MQRCRTGVFIDRAVIATPAVLFPGFLSVSLQNGGKLCVLCGGYLAVLEWEIDGCVLCRSAERCVRRGGGGLCSPHARDRAPADGGSSDSRFAGGGVCGTEEPGQL